MDLHVETTLFWLYTEVSHATLNITGFNMTVSCDFEQSEEYQANIMTLHSESFAFEDADLYGLGFLGSIAFSAASKGYKPFSITRLLSDFVTNWNKNIVANQGQNLIDIGDNLYFNATIIEAPKLQYEISEDDTFIHFSPRLRML